jgi:superfamily II DNA or RNA helicase
MSSLKDICLQVHYEGNPATVTSAFHLPVSAATALYRIRTGSLSRANLTPAALGLGELLKAGKPVRFLFAPPAQPNQDASASPARAAPDLLAQLEALASGAAVPPGLQDRTSLFQLKIAAPTPQPFTGADSAATTGFFTDQSGTTVCYQVEDVSAQANYAPAPLSLAISWSWGDPQLRVRRAVDLFDKVWNGGDSAAPVTPANSELTSKLLAVLLYLEQHPESQPPPEDAIRLFPHQQHAVAEWKSRDFKGVFKMCTGAGKTISSLAGARDLAEHRAAHSMRLPPVVISVPTRVLADQWIKEIKRFGFRSIVPAYNAFEQWSPLLEPTLRSQTSNQPRFVVTTYRTFADERFLAKLQRAGASDIEALWIADEMHNLASPRLRNAMRQVGQLFKFRLGLSATPEIEGDLTATEQLLDYFGGICASYELADGIRDGVLCPYRYYPIPAYLAPDLGQKYLRLLRDIHDAKPGASSLMNLYRQTRDLLRTSGIQVAAFRDLLRGMRQSQPELSHTLIYCPPGYGTYGGDQSDEIDTDQEERRLIEEVIQVLRENGLSSASILGETPADQRAHILQRFSDGRLNTLCAIGCLDEGVDVPSIKRAIVLYSVDREKQFIQRRGRILRQPRGVTGKIAEIHDILILPQGSDMSAAHAEALLNRELRRYRKFAELALNRQEADHSISTALALATRALRAFN